jgi:hypothetical protein
MSSSRAFHAPTAILGAAFLSVCVAGCTDDGAGGNTGGASTGAAAGVGGSGQSGAAGSTSTGGTGGSAGGSGGAGGSTGGASGAGGSAGNGGNAGTAAGAGGVAAGSGGGSGAGAAGTAGSGGAGGSAAGGGGASAGGAGGAGQGGGAGQAGASGVAGAAGATSEHFSFFVTSLDAVRRESGSMDGFGGDLGGLEGADAICTRIAESSMPGAGAKGWRAFLSTQAVDAISRIGTGPWYDRLGRVVAEDVAGLLEERPDGDSIIVNDLPNELGQPNRSGTGTGMDDNHDTITASNLMGEWDGGPTCDDWTSAVGGDGPRVGHSWPAQSGRSWMQAHMAPGCVPSVQLVQMGAGSGDGIGNGGGYGGWYCFALMP